MKPQFFAVAAFAGIAAVAGAQSNIDPIWKISTGTGSKNYSWFPASGDTVRGMALNPATGNLLVASRTGGNLVHRINAATGDEITPEVPAPAGGFSAGTLVLNKVAAVSGGMIFATNLDTSNTFRIYRALDETTAFTLVYDQAVAIPGDALREGDAMIARRIDANTIEILVNGGTSTLFIYTSTDNGATFTRTTQTLSGSGITYGSAPHLRFDPVNPDTTLWYRNPSQHSLVSINRTTGVGTTTADGTAARTPFDIRVDSNNSLNRLYTLGIGASAAGSGDLSATVRSIAAPTTVIANLRHVAQGPIGSGNTVANGNGAGDVIVNGTTTYILYTNNAITAFDNTPAPVSMSGFSID